MIFSYQQCATVLAKFILDSCVHSNCLLSRPQWSAASMYIMMRLVLFLLPLSPTAFSFTRPSIYRTFGSIPSSTFRKDTHTKSLQNNKYIKLSLPSHQCQQRQITTIHASANSGSDINNMKILGVCGGIGSGKSTACQLMVDSLGCVARIGEYLFFVYSLVYCTI